MPQLNLFSTSQDQEIIFNEAFERLNPRQRRAVELTEGPVFVLAGPGTGKTQILALRIGHILKTTDTQAHNILCLTYTDAGTIAMRKRLIEFIGSTAYNVHINTFHAFANQVIQENMHLFGAARELQPLSDLERVELMIELIDNMPMNHPLKKLKGNSYYIQGKLQNLFNDMKQEGWTPEHVIEKIEKHLEEKQNDPKMFYSRKTTSKGKTFQKGDLKEFEFKKINDQMDQLKAGALLFNEYEALLRKYGRYDYNDMILWVLHEFENNQDLLLRYQEQYLYFLVDEYQDTNGVQNRILENLASFWDVPNVFAVGDDDQSIYRFQGANMDNITEFHNKYNPKLIVLDKNYRSTQQVLKATGSLIKHNEGRLSNILHIDKDILASGKNADLTIPVNIIELPNVSQEEAYIYYQIKRRSEHNYPLDKIAVVYRKHALVERLTKLLEAQNIPLNIRKKVNILEEPFISEIIGLMKFIHSSFSESGYREELLFKTMIAQVFGIKYQDLMKIGKLSYYDFESNSSVSWMDVIGDKVKMAEAGIEEYEKIHDIYEKLTSWEMSSPRLTLQVFFEKLITESGFLNQALSDPDAKWKMQLLNTLFDFIKEESIRNPKLSLGKFLDTIHKMENNGVSIPVMKITTAEDGVHFITAHSAKGLEFETVYLIGANSDNWESARSGGNYEFKYPETLVSSNKEHKIEDERRLFFVAGTRAEKELFISYATENDKGKEIESSRFVQEIRESEDKAEVIDNKEIKIEDDKLFDFLGRSMEYLVLPENEMIDSKLVDEVLKSYQMSVTSLNKFLHCPVSFYYENIIRVPSARNSYAGFGLAVHYALEHFFREKQRNTSEGFGAATLMIDFFKKGMHIFRSHFTDKEFENNMHYGKTVLSGYHADQLQNWFKSEKFSVEHRISNVEYQNVPIKGMIDKVEIFKDHVNVIDYKTGNPDNAKKKMSPPKNEGDLGGDYWRQILFYKILVDNDPSLNWNVQTGEVRLVEPDKLGSYKHFKIPVNAKDIEFVGGQLVSAWEKINNHEFSKGCNKPDCAWCSFVKQRYT